MRVLFINAFDKYIDITMQYNVSLCILTQGDIHTYYCTLLVFVLPYLFLPHPFQIVSQFIFESSSLLVHLCILSTHTVVFHVVGILYL